MHEGQFVYCGRRATLSIDDVLPCRRILEDAVVCNVEHHDRRLWYPSAEAPGDYAIVISHNTDNDARTRGAPRWRKATMNHGKVNNARHPPVLPLLRRRRQPLLGEGGPHHLIYVG
ncbi:large ribosomal subunit protein uL2x-like [Miscanthus floridulus]|uniref:large ribosomal subunit protein uL2x-like n=1 Tax=Miscanthus floridulus TaxID=154761 RepID=UPI003459AFD7